MSGKSARKQVRSSRRKQIQNKSARSEVKTSITSAEKLIFSGGLDAARAAVAAAVTSLDKAAERGIIHGNNADRRKSRLMKKLNAAAASSTAKPEPQETTKEATKETK